jgi:N-acetylglucosaminyl-diphospho-decaprenol L-rhamnosyltransferase
MWPMAVQTSIVIVNYNSSSTLSPMLAAMEIEQALTCEVMVVDNASTDDSVEVVQQWPAVRVIRMERNAGFAAAANRGFAEAAGDVTVFCHSDLVVPAHTLAELADIVRQGIGKRTAAAMPRLINPDRTSQPFIGRLPGLARGTVGVFRPTALRKLEEPQLDHVQDHQWALTACVAVDSDLLHKLGGFDPRFIRYYHDADLCQRLHERSYRINIQRNLVAVHHGGDRGEPPPHLQRLMRLDQKKYFEKHRPAWEAAVLKLGEKGLRLINKDAI